MKNYEKRIHSFAISFLITMVIWVLVNAVLLPIAFHDFIIMEILAAFGNILCTFIKDYYKISPRINQHENESE